MGGRGGSIKTKRSKLNSIGKAVAEKNIPDGYLSPEQIVGYITGFSETDLRELQAKIYQEFSGVDQDKDGFEYDDKRHDQDIIDWFAEHTNNQELFDNMTDEERIAWRSWISGDYMEGTLYPDHPRFDENSYKFFIGQLDKGNLDTPITVRRRATTELLFGIDKILDEDDLSSSLGQLQAMEGAIVTNGAPMSAGAASSGLTIGGGYLKPVEYVFHMPAMKGAGLYIGDPKINSVFGPDQREFVINSDLVWAVGKTRKVKRGRETVYEVDMYCLGRGDHYQI